ncbi:MAG: HIT family protein [Candidatus Bathyarchaeota archaeon]|nr:HIT family protein [Candidatus Bathyarchaeota archaeon]
MKSEENCIFCQIVAKKSPASILYEDADVMAFLDIRPLHMGHSLVISKDHYIDIFDTPTDILSKIHAVSKQVALAVKQATGSEGISVFQQNGKAAGQDIFHIHVHVVPRFEGTGLPHFSDLKVVERSALDAIAMKIRQQL